MGLESYASYVPGDWPETWVTEALVASEVVTRFSGAAAWNDTEENE